MYVEAQAWFRREGDSDHEKTDSEILIPCGIFSKGDYSNGEWPTMYGAPVDSGFAWQDDNCDGHMSLPEFHSFAGFSFFGVWGVYVDEEGTLWVSSEDSWVIAWSALPELSSCGCLRYNFSAPPLVKFVDLPNGLPPLDQVSRVLYVSSIDALYLTGFTSTLINEGNTWGYAGRWVQRYDGFLRGSRSIGPGWMLPWSGTCSGVCTTDNAKAVAAVDDLFLAVVGESATVYVYNGSTGLLLGTMSVADGGAAMGGYSGWIDIPFALTVSRSARGELGPGRYVAFVEEDGRQKIIMYSFIV